MSTLSYFVPAVILYTLIASQPTESSLINSTVLDTDGHELQSSTEYYIFPIIESPNPNPNPNRDGGGVALSSKYGTCPYYVMQEPLEASNGHPLELMTHNDDNHKPPEAISLSTDLNIAFSAATICVQSTVWKVGGVDEVTGHRYVTSGGRTGRLGLESESNWFRIEKHGGGNSYKIVHCPSLCGSCRAVCSNVGVFYEDGKRWLGLSDEPLLVAFKKV